VTPELSASVGAKNSKPYFVDHHISFLYTTSLFFDTLFLHSFAMSRLHIAVGISKEHLGEVMKTLPEGNAEDEDFEVWGKAFCKALVRRYKPCNRIAPI
jgi:hypothetical protein